MPELQASNDSQMSAGQNLNEQVEAQEARLRKLEQQTEDLIQ